MSAAESSVESLWDELVRLVNAQFESPSFRRLLSLRFSRERARHYTIQMVYFVRNRRDCWGFVQGAAPLDVKRLIWAHERDELIGEEDAGKPDHVTLAIREGEALGLAGGDFEAMPPAEGAAICFYAWIHLARSRPWLEALAASAILEMRNSEELVRGGSMSRRIGEKLQRDLGIPLEKLVNTNEHVEADVEHAQLLLGVAREHAQNAEARRAILRGAEESLRVDRVFRGHMADLLAALPDDVEQLASHSGSRDPRRGGD